MILDGYKGIVSALAPMQDVSGADFMRLVADCGAPDIFFAEYFRVHEFSRLDAHVLDAVLSNPSGKPVCAQIIGEDVFHIKRTIGLLKKYPQITYLDLNAGCPAPKVYRKNVGGGLLREPKKIKEILTAMRGEWHGKLSLKTRLGFDSDNAFTEVVEIANSCGLDFITLHGRTVKQLYRGDVNYTAIAQAVRQSDIPVIANGDIDTARKALDVAESTKCAGVMIGRNAMRNPWIFRQISELKNSQKIFEPTLGDVYGYIQKLYEQTISNKPDIFHPDGRLKKFLNFIALSVDENGDFLREMRLARGIDNLLEVCKKHLAHSPEKPFADKPYPKLCARPNHE